MDIREIPEGRGCYFVSAQGEIYSNKSGSLTKLKPIERHGYYTIEVRFGGERLIRKIHRVVYETFLSEIEEGMIVDHIDRDKHNNTVGNLRTITPKENSNNVDKSLFNGKIKCVAEKDGETIEFPTAAACARHIGCNPESVRRMLKCAKPYRLKGWEIKILKTL